MTHKTQPTAHAEITAPISADLRRIEQSAARAADRDTHFYLAGWNGARGNEDSHEHFRRALQAAPPAPAGMVRVADLVSVGNRFYRGNWLSVEGVSELIDAALAASPSAPATVAAPSDELSRAEQNHAALWRQHVGKLDALIAFCPTCSQGFATNAEMTRDEIIFECGKTSGRSGAQAAAPAQAVAVPIELQGVKEAVEQGGGFWRSCTGCHELNEGHATGPVSKVFGCALGNGCSECGGIGAVWDDTDYDAMADAMAAPAQEHATQLAGQRPRTPGSFVNAAGIHASDKPATVVRKLDAAFHDAVTFADTPPQTQGCTRSHPHENMSPMCVLRTEIARLNHAAAIAGAQQAAVIVTVTQESPLKQSVEFQWAFGALQPGEHKLYLAPAQAQEDACPVLDDEWKRRMLDGRALVRDDMGCGYHPALPTLDEGMNPKQFFEALGIQLAGSMADGEMDMDAYDAMVEATDYNVWTPCPPDGEGWALVAIFDTEDGPAAWWIREAAPKQPVRRGRKSARDAALPSWWPDFIQSVAELPDRNSPEDEPDAMVATADELGTCAINAIDAARAAQGGDKP